MKILLEESQNELDKYLNNETAAEIEKIMQKKIPEKKKKPRIKHELIIVVNRTKIVVKTFIAHSRQIRYMYRESVLLVRIPRRLVAERASRNRTHYSLDQSPARNAI